MTCPMISFAASEPWTIEDVLEVSSELSQQIRDPEAAPQKSLPQAFVLVSFSMPQASLKRLAVTPKTPACLWFSVVCRTPKNPPILSCRSLISVARRLSAFN